MNIETMPLYVNVERIYKELDELGYTRGSRLQPEDLFPFDQFHYHGTDVVAHAASLLSLGSNSKVLEIGSGLGGPARYLAHKVGCHVTALEVQPRLHEIATDLTHRTGLDHKVTHVLGNALTHPLPAAAFDAVVSWLAIHHIPSRPLLLARCAECIGDNGKIYIEDLYQRAPLADPGAIFGVTLTSTEEYVADMRNAGFTNIKPIDMTDDWAAFCRTRANAFRAGRDRHIRVHGSATFEMLEGFFSTVVQLFESGSLGGLRLTATKAKSK
jgi:cyclopropane fatty-acyl-phospholipid synthase-like methyltransferase